MDERLQRQVASNSAFCLVLGILVLIVLVAATQSKPWIDVTDRLQQQQIDECRRDTRDLSVVERRLDDLEAEVLFLREQLGMLEDGERVKAAVLWHFELGVGE